jgi:hypothetical protein
MSADALKTIEKKTKALAEARDVLLQSQIDLRAILREATGEHLPSIQKQADKVAKLQGEIEQLVDDNRDLFADGQKTMLLNEIKVGLQMGRETIEIADEAKTVAAIEAKLADKADMLIDTKKSVGKTALKKLTDAELKAIGCKRVPGSDEVVVAPAASEIDKLVKLLVPEAA